MTQHYQAGETATVAAAKLSVPAGVASLNFAGVHLQDWVLLLTIIYTALMIGEKLWRWVRGYRQERRKVRVRRGSRGG